MTDAGQKRPVANRHNALAGTVAPPPAADILQMSNPANIIVRGATAIGKYSGSYGPCHQAAPNSRGRRVLCNMVRLGYRKPALQGRCILVRQDPSTSGRLAQYRQGHRDLSRTAHQGLDHYRLHRRVRHNSGHPVPNIRCSCRHPAHARDDVAALSRLRRSRVS